MSAIYVVVDSDMRRELVGVRGRECVSVQGYVGSREESRKVVEVRIWREDGKFKVEVWQNREEVTVC